MGNISIFDFIGNEHDHLFESLQALVQGEETTVKGYVVRLTDKFYELENEIEHLAFPTIDHCYRYLNGVQHK